MSYSSYAGAKGKSNPLPASPFSGGGARRELSDAEKEAVAGLARKVKEHIPEAWDFMKALSSEGLIDGMRCIASVTVFEGDDHGVG